MVMHLVPIVFSQMVVKTGQGFQPRPGLRRSEGSTICFWTDAIDLSVIPATLGSFLDANAGDVVEVLQLKGAYLVPSQCRICHGMQLKVLD